MTADLQTQSSPGRAYALDALRGIAILLMILSAQEPFGSLPSWMYHAQCPPPSHAFNPAVAGITWVDLVFPFFIFSMGAAIPLAMSRKVAKGATSGQLAWGALKRWGLLVAFAIFNRHMNPQVISKTPSIYIWLLGLAGFLLMFGLWARWPWKLSKGVERLMKFGSLAVTVGILAFLTYPDGSGFSLFRSNIILLVLAEISFFGALAWIFTRGNISLRLGILAVMFAVRLSFGVEGSWVQAVGAHSEIPFVGGLIKGIVADANLKYVNWIYGFTWFFNWRFLKYLFVLIPATIIGDLLAEWTQSQGRAAEESLKKYWRTAAAAVLMFAIVAVVVAGLKARWVVGTTVVSAVLCVAGLWIFAGKSDGYGRLIGRMFRWGAFWLMLGLLFEPYEGGIKKDYSTMSYYFVTAGLAIFVLIGFSIIIDVFRKQRLLQLLIDNGQNPMIAYAGSSNLLNPIMAITGLSVVRNKIFAAHSWTGFWVGVLLTLCLACVVSIFTKKRVFLRT